MAEELNVKQIRWVEQVAEPEPGSVVDATASPERWIELSKQLTPELRREGLMREVIRHVQSARKQAGLQVDDRITLQLATTDQQLDQAIAEHAETIAAETLATLGQASGHQLTVSIDGAQLVITLQIA